MQLIANCSTANWASVSELSVPPLGEINGRNPAIYNINPTLIIFIYFFIICVWHKYVCAPCFSVLYCYFQFVVSSRASRLRESRDRYRLYLHKLLTSSRWQVENIRKSKIKSNVICKQMLNSRAAHNLCVSTCVCFYFLYRCLLETSNVAMGHGCVCEQWDRHQVTGVVEQQKHSHSVICHLDAYTYVVVGSMQKMFEIIISNDDNSNQSGDTFYIIRFSADNGNGGCLIAKSHLGHSNVTNERKFYQKIDTTSISRKSIVRT